MIYKILVKSSKTSKNYAYYQVQKRTEMVDYETTHIEDLGTMYKELLASYTTDQLKLVHELEPELVINLKDEAAESTSTTVEDLDTVDDEF